MVDAGGGVGAAACISFTSSPYVVLDAPLRQQPSQVLQQLGPQLGVGRDPRRPLLGGHRKVLACQWRDIAAEHERDEHVVGRVIAALALNRGVVVGARPRLNSRRGLAVAAAEVAAATV